MAQLVGQGHHPETDKTAGLGEVVLHLWRLGYNLTCIYKNSQFSDGRDLPCHLHVPRQGTQGVKLIFFMTQGVHSIVYP